MTLLSGHLLGLTFLFADLKMSGRVQWPWWQCVAPSIAAVVIHGTASWFSKDRE